jgi:hypothetical protein
MIAARRTLSHYDAITSHGTSTGPTATESVSNSYALDGIFP